MNILNKLSIRNLKLNKKRTISTIIGIILSCSLICAVATMFTSFQETLIQNAVNETGYYHLKMLNVSDEKLKTLENNRDIKGLFTIYENGYAKLENGQNEDKPYLKLYSMDKAEFDNLKFNLIEGEFPSNKNEIIISKHIIDNGKVNFKIGDKINIDVGKRESLNGYKLDSSNPYHEELEQLVDTKNHEFTIVGIIERPGYGFEQYSDSGYSIITTNMNEGSKNVYISLKHPKEYKEVIPMLLGETSYNDASDSHEVNRELLRWEAFAFSDSTVQMLYAVIGVVIFIIIFTSVFCIRNSFAIATTEKMKMYGMLSSVGATKKQIKKNVIFEALILGLIGIPLGIIGGIFAVFILIKIVNSIGGEYFLNNMEGIVVKITILPIILSIILGIITIYLSAISSARKASKVSPIELLRNADEIKIKAKKLKTPKIISNVFKTGGELAYKNLKRSRKKYRTTVISLTISIFIFITMNALLINMFDMSSNYYEDYDYNVRLYVRGNEPSDVDKIKRVNYIDECFVLYENYASLKIFDLDKINEIDEIGLIEDSIYDKEQKKYIPTGNGKYSGIYLEALDNDSFQKFARKIGANPDKLKEKGILCDNYLYYENDKQIETRRYKYNVGETVTGKLGDKEISIKVGFISKERPYGIEGSYYGGGYLVVNKDEFKNIEFAPAYMCIESSNPDELINEIKALDIDDVGFMNLEEQAKENRAMSLIVKIFLYGFIAIITLIGVTNIFNTITSNMELRQKEFAMLKSIGMTKKEFNRMINLETIFYSTKSLIYGVTLGLVGTFALYKAFSVKIEKGMYIPINPIIISIIAVFILVFMIMRYSLSKINKQNTIETIRNENI